MLAPGSPLPGEASCAAKIYRSGFELRPENTSANHQIPTASQIAGLSAWGASAGFDPMADSLRKQITGNFTGTTDEILQWVACKWGVNIDIVRAEAVTESHWRQSMLGDYTDDKVLCPAETWRGTGCYQSYGILQIKYIYNKSAWPMSRDDTAFSAEYTYGSIRACYEGWTTYLYDFPTVAGYPRYHAGDLWGCLGVWYSGRWYSQDALNYVSSVKMHLANRDWERDNF
ncbi:MAG: hypothetical protein E6J34_12050 [Chloroflexi bacterium]|nr:MAG: hypothetical protein E6J34_12050 [Chloroflexota bacterium]